MELHIEQGPIMDVEGVKIGAVENLHGIHWQRVTIEGVANHAGTTDQFKSGCWSVQQRSTCS